MPIYEYECKACGDRFECLILQAVDIAKCPRCGSEDVIKLMSRFRQLGSSSGDSELSSSSSCNSCTATSCRGCTK